MALDRHVYAAAVLMDVSKVFNCLQYRVLVSMLDAYGLSTGAVD